MKSLVNHSQLSDGNHGESAPLSKNNKRVSLSERRRGARTLYLDFVLVSPRSVAFRRGSHPRHTKTSDVLLIIADKCNLSLGSLLRVFVIVANSYNIQRGAVGEGW